MREFSYVPEGDLATCKTCFSFRLDGNGAETTIKEQQNDDI